MCLYSCIGLQFLYYTSKEILLLRRRYKNDKLDKLEINNRIDNFSFRQLQDDFRLRDGGYIEIQQNAIC
jgi:hypothetical protein